MEKDLYKNLSKGFNNDDLKPQWNFYDLKEESNNIEELEFEFEFEDEIYNNIIKNIDSLVLDKWYKIKDKEKIKAIKELMECNFLPDISFNDSYDKIKRSCTESILNFKF